MPQPKDKSKVEEWKKKISNSLKGKRCSMRTEFGKGHIPHNKGTIGLMKVNSGSFKKGNKPKNYMGGLKICKDGIYIINRRKNYTYIRNGKKVFISNYESLSRKKYREAYGKYDKNLIIYHTDGDIYNNDIDNLELINRTELLKRNHKIKNHICKICGKAFSSTASYIKCCSKECMKINDKNLTRESQIKNRAKKSLLINETIKTKGLNSINTVK